MGWFICFELVLITLILSVHVLLAMLDVVSRDSFIASIVQSRGTGLCPPKALGKKSRDLGLHWTGRLFSRRLQTYHSRHAATLKPGQVALHGHARFCRVGRF